MRRLEGGTVVTQAEFCISHSEAIREGLRPRVGGGELWLLNEVLGGKDVRRRCEEKMQ